MRHDLLGLIKAQESEYYGYFIVLHEIQNDRKNAH